jgi:hypothetical protein
VPPSYSEGFDRLFRVRLIDSSFEVNAETRD